jgi:hypothetical protein
MKIYIIKTALIFISLQNGLFGNYYMSKNEEAVNRFIGQASRSFQLKPEWKKRITVCGTTKGMPGGIVENLGLAFDIKGPMSRDEIRKMLLEMGQQFLNKLNQDKQLQPYLQHRPFTPDDIDLSLYFRDSKNGGLRDPHIGYAALRYGKLVYCVIEEQNGIPRDKFEYKETYEEALKLAKE